MTVVIKYLKPIQHNIEKNKTVIHWSRYKRSSLYHVIESILVISPKKFNYLKFSSCKVDLKKKKKRWFKKFTA